MASPPQHVGKFVITLIAAACVLLILLCPDPRAEVGAQDRSETDRPDLPLGKRYEEQEFDDRQVRPRYLVTFVSSEKTSFSVPSSATVVSVTNLADRVCHVSVEWFRGFDTNDNASCAADLALGTNFTADFCSRDLPIAVTACDSLCALDLLQGRAIVSASCRKIGVSGRVYYTAPEDDTDVEAITDSNVVRVGGGNRGD